MVEYKVLLSPSHGSRRILRYNVTINTRANRLRLIASRFTSVPTILLLSPHLCCQHFNFWRQGRSSEPRDAPNTDRCPLFTHYSWITTTTSQYRFKDFQEYGDTCIYDLFVCRNGLGNGQYLSVGASSFPLKETSFSV